MKRISLIVLGAALLFSTSLRAQEADNNLFNHLGVGVAVGTDGIGFDVAAPIGNYVQVRAGYNFLPQIKPTITVDYEYDNHQDLNTHWESDGQITIKKNDFKLLFDVYPFKKSSFRVTAGAYIGGSDIATVKNKGKLNGVLEADYGDSQITLGEGPTAKDFGTDPDGNVKGRVRVNGFKPYLGIGFGRSVPGKLVSVSCDLGVQFWGTPKLEIYDYEVRKDTQGNILTDTSGWRTIEKSDFTEDEDMYDVMKIVDKVTVYPTINIRVGFRAF
ncbi:MAG: hypothetical protein IJ659_09570 [Alloprevotella sp.]|nr:hypothetical protein [Alloprevotella sp.]MBR1595003.1 hypothetical protein [Alloprevotella sp.]